MLCMTITTTLLLVPLWFDPGYDKFMEKIAILVDVQNIYYTTRQAFSRQFNYRAFWTAVTEGRELVAAYAYAIESRVGKQAGFQQILRDIGFEVKLKPYIQRSDGSAKGDWDVGITLDMVEIAEKVDTVILASGDGDFDLALQRISDRFGCTTEVYGVEQLTAGTLIRAATKYVPIEEELLMPK
jgi:uncharacterized LabA/DUF88 family protein